jgi:predicted AAA+ superfamily ATPase
MHWHILLILSISYTAVGVLTAHCCLCFSAANMHTYTCIYIYKQPGTYYKLSEADMRTYFPEGVAGFLKHEFDYAALRDNRAIMHREPARSIIGQLKRFTGGDPSAQRAFLIRGERGTGKSSALNHVVHYARSNGWVVVFMPKVSHSACNCHF